MSRLQKRTTTFVTLPIAALAAASIGIVLASLVIGAREADAIALSRQRETIEHAIDQHGLSLARELRIQTVWTEAYNKTREHDTSWIRSFYGIYLSQILGYDRIYVLASDDTPVFGFVPSDQSASSSFASIGGGLKDLLKAVRVPQSMPADYNVVVTDVPLGNGSMLQHRAVADVRSIRGRPATVVVSTIVPDRGYRSDVTEPPMLLVAVEDIDKEFTRRLGANFGFRDLQWVTHETPAGDASNVVKSLDGAPVGTLAWRKDRPGLEFIRRVAPGLGISLILIAALTYILILWGKWQAKQILQSEEHATLAARTDALTGLPNRVALREAFARLLDGIQGDKSTLGVLSIDIDQFKSINDAFGNAVGDGVLIAVARRLQSLVGAGGIVARPDGDSFVMLVPGLDDKAAAELATDALTALAEPFDLDGGTRVFATVSVGYAIGPRDGDTGDELLRRAELAVEKAKEEAGETVVAFAPEMDAEVTYRRMLEMALRSAVAEGSINVFYQPLMDASGRRVLGVEALARWTDPTLGPISPEIFIPLAEETGLIQNIGEHVLRRAVEDGKAWPGINVAVNVSASQIHHGDVVGVVRDVLGDSQFPAERLEIEITESVLLADEKRANEQMRGLQALGVKVALDDFGTGYSGLQYLRRFGFDKLKIDRSFIDGAGEPLDSSVILASIIKLGQDLDLTITAEGVETVEQQRWLQTSGCDQLQGYLFSRPLPADQMTAFIAAHTAKDAIAS
ncbi:MAG: EAL domain-containing protein [Hyphomicrobium sp.]|nr:MAG: EAL domain-containing protein [Hyphomicrobium sp.]